MAMVVLFLTTMACAALTMFAVLIQRLLGFGPPGGSVVPMPQIWCMGPRYSWSGAC
jgi:hypothetical protein